MFLLDSAVPPLDADRFLATSMVRFTTSALLSPLATARVEPLALARTVDSDVLDRVNAWKERLQELATEDDLTLNVEPDRKYLFNNFVPESGYPMFSMYSELGAHAGAIGNTLFSLRLDSREIAYTLGEAYVDRGFWLSAGVTHLSGTRVRASRRVLD